MDEDLLESSRVSDKEQHPIPAGEGGRVTEAPVHQDRDSHRSEQAGPDVDVACGGDQLCRGDGVTIEAPPTRRPRFRDRPGHWWLLAAVGRYEPAQVGAPPLLATHHASPQANAATLGE